MPTKDVDNLNFLNGATSEKLDSLTVPRWRRFRRCKLRSLMATDINIKYNKRLANLSYTRLRLLPRRPADPNAPETWTFFFYISWATAIA
jgi:hypothetical protein